MRTAAFLMMGLTFAAVLPVQAVCVSGPQLRISEVFYDPSGPDDNLEWIELYNAGSSTIVLDGEYSLGWGGSDYVFGQLDLVGSIPPGGVFLVGGPDTSASNGDPVFDMPTTFLPSNLQNAGPTADGIALFDRPAAQVDAATVPIDAIIYGGSNDNGLIDAGGGIGVPDVGDALSGTSLVRDAGGWSNPGPLTPNVSALLPSPSNLIISEVMYDPTNADDDLEWVELFNRGPTAILLDGNYSLGWGGADYTFGTLDLSGTIQPSETWVIGGPISSGDNGTPNIDLSVSIVPTIQNSGATADGVALFTGSAAGISALSVPVDAVIYGGSNDSGLIDASGASPAPHVIDVLSGQSVVREPDGWVAAPSPTPNVSPMTAVACIAFGDGFEN